VATLEPKSGSTLTGRATFSTGASGQVTLVLSLEGATPGVHAAHLHDTGDCSAPDAKSAGGHWNPTSAPHGRWGSDGHHLGDVGNVTVGADGKGTLTLTTDRWQVGGGQLNDVVGHSVIVHGGVDDFSTQPTGNAGNRAACGVIALQPSATGK
jgi:Cu-Zn family superoxide dismutase